MQNIITNAIQAIHLKTTYRLKKFFGVGECLRNISHDEEYQRSAVGRYYYAAFGLVKNYFESNHHIKVPSHNGHSYSATATKATNNPDIIADLMVNALHKLLNSMEIDGEAVHCKEIPSTVFKRDENSDMEDDDAFPFDYFDDNALSGFNLECLRNMVGIEEEWDEKVFKQNNKIFEPCKELDLKDLSLSTIEEGNKKEDVSSLKIGTIKTYDGLSSVCLNHAIFVYSAAVVEGYGNDVIDAYNNTSVNDIIPVCFYGENKLDEYVKTGIVTVKES